MFKYWLVFTLFFPFFAFYGQQISLPDVLVSDTAILNYSKSLKKQVLVDSLLFQNKPALTQVLNQNTLLFFKENGNGMVSSPTFRGSTAQQTAVVWNGININSQLNGQTDFNTINSRNFSNIYIRSGGGSAIYGTSAIGGSIHLNNILLFNTKSQSQTIIETGSFSTFGISNNTLISKKNSIFQIGFSTNSSKNNYPLVGYQGKNINGNYFYSNISANFAQKISDNNEIYFYSNISSNNRNLSPAIQTISNANYKNNDFRNLIHWKTSLYKIDNSFKIAYLTEEYQYYLDKLNDFFYFGKAKTVNIKNDIGYSIFNKIRANSVIELIQTQANGSDLIENNRIIYSFSQLLKYQVLKNLLVESTFRKENTTQYKSPFLYSFGAQYSLSKNYQIQANHSKNFRIPSFNDLYWQTGGNPNLSPETAILSEITNTFIFKKNSIVLTGFISKYSNLIQWKPNVNGLWSPENVLNAENYGVEVELKSDFSIKKHKINATFLYGFTNTKNLQTQKEFIYVPNHKWVLNANYNFKNFTFLYQFVYTGRVFTASDNKSILPDYQVHGVNFGYFIGSKKHKISCQVSNVFNQEYQTVLNRPLPGVHFTFQLIFTI